MGTPYIPMAKSGFSIGVLVCELNICIPLLLQETGRKKRNF